MKTYRLQFLLRLLSGVALVVLLMALDMESSRWRTVIVMLAVCLLYYCGYLTGKYIPQLKQRKGISFKLVRTDEVFEKEPTNKS